MDRRDFMTMAATAPIYLWTKGTTAQEAVYDAKLCISDTGVFQIRTPQNPVPSWDRCEFEVPVIWRAFNTPKLTWVLSVGYDPKRKMFTRAAAGNTQEYLLPGEDLLIFDYKIRHRNLAYSLDANRFFLANLSNSETKLLSQTDFRKYAEKHGEPIAMVTSETPVFDNDFESDGTAPAGALMIEKDSVFLPLGEELVQVMCIDGSCGPGLLWIKRGQLTELSQAVIKTGQLPKIIEFPKQTDVKDCKATATTSTTDEYTRKLEAEFAPTNLLGLKFGAGLEKMEKAFQSRSYDASTQIDWSTFTIVEFDVRGPKQPHLRQQRLRKWTAVRSTELVVQVTTDNCDKDAPNVYETKIKSPQGDHVIGGWRTTRRIRDSKEHKAFVDQALAKTQGRIDPWIIRHLAAAISAFAPAQ